MAKGGPAAVDADEGFLKNSYPKFAKVEERPMLAGAIGDFMVTTHFTTWIFLGRGISLSPRRSYICFCSGSAILHSLR